MIQPGHKTNILIMFLLGIIPLLWFRDAPLIAGADFEFTFSPSESFRGSSYTWDEVRYAGWDQSQVSILKLPYYLFLSALSSVGIPLDIVEKIVFAALFVLPGLSMFYLSLILFKDNLSRLLSSLFYTLNLYTLIHWHNGQMFVILAYGVIPLLLGIFLRGLKKKQILKYSVLFGLASVLMAPGSRFPLMAVALFLTASLSLLYLLLHRNKIEITFTLKFTVVCFLMFLIANLWWITPVLSLLQSSSENVQFLLGGLQHVYLESGFTSFLEVSRLLGEWGWYTTFNGAPYYTFANSYSTDPLLVIITFLIPVLAWSALLAAPKSHLVLSVSIMTVLGVLLSMGTYLPFGAFYQAFYQNAPFFWIFRNPYRSFVPIIALGYAFLIGALIERVRAINIQFIHRFHIKIGREKCRFALSALLLVLIVSSTWPFFTGDVIEEQFRFHEVPSYYSQANDYFMNQSSNSKVLLLPSSLTFGVKYNWGYVGPDILPMVVARPQIRAFAYYSHTSEILNYLHRSYESGYNGRLAEMLSLMGIEYVMIDYSVDSTYYNVTPAYRLERIIETQPNILFEQEFGPLKIYRNLLPTDEISASKTITLVIGKLDALESLLQHPHSNKSTALFFMDDLQNGKSSFISRNSDTIFIYHSAIDFINNSGWTQLSSGALDTDAASFRNASVTYEFQVPENGTYELLANVRWDRLRGLLKAKIDDGPWSNGSIPYAEVDCENSYYSEISLGKYELSAGLHAVSLMNSKPSSLPEGHQELSYIVLVNSKEVYQKESEVKVDYTKITPTQYKIDIETDSPFFLIFLQSYAPGWKLTIATEEIESIQVNGFANAFYVPKTGKYQALMEYLPQRLFEVSALVSIVLQAICILLVIMTSRHSRFLFRAIARKRMHKY